MILLDEDSSQRPKLPTDPSVGPTNRVPTEADPSLPPSSSQQRPASLNTLLPNYESLEAQHPSPGKPRGGRRSWRTRLGKFMAIALVIYLCLFVILGVPTYVLKWKAPRKFRWRGNDIFDHPEPPPPMDNDQMELDDLSHPFFEESIFSCGTWDQQFDPPGGSGNVAGTASMRLPFHLTSGINLRVNSSSENLKDYISGTLTVDINPDKTASSAVLMGNTQFSNRQLFEASSVCLTNLFNTTEVVIHVPDRENFPSDRIGIDLQLLLPPSSIPYDFQSFATRLPMFKQYFGDLGPHIFFGFLKLTDSSSAISVDSVTASSIIVRTSGAEISGNFSASERLILDTINGAVFANISLLNHRKHWKHTTKLVVETGNGPIVAQVNVRVDERDYYAPPKHGHFRTKFKTFNAPMNISIVHAAASKPALLEVCAKNTLGAIDVTLDSLYTGTFDLRNRAADVMVQETFAPDGVVDNEYNLHVDQRSTERTRGWIGDNRRPEEFDRHTLGRVELVNSLSPINLHLARLRPSNAERR